MSHKLLMLSLLVLSSGLVHAAEKTVTASGNCIKLSTPDRGRVVVTAEATEKTVQEANKKASQIYNSVLAAVKKLALADQEVQTTEMTVYEDITWANNKRKSLGFKSRMGLAVISSDVTKLSEVIRIAADKGVTEIGGLSMFISPKKMNEEKEECLSEAILNARSKATKMAKAAGVDLGSVLNISESDVAVGGGPRPFAMMESKSMASMDGAAIETGNETISVNVIVQFVLK